MFMCWSFLFLILFAIVSVQVIFFLQSNNFSNGVCVPQWKVGKLSEDLKNNIHSQDASIKKIVNYFIEKENHPSFDVVTFIGGTGVGKSYTSEIIKNNLKDTANILNFFPHLYNKEDLAYASLSVCRCNLINLDNLKTEDIDDAVEFIYKLKKRAKNYCIRILTIFNTQETNFDEKTSIDLDSSVTVVDKKFKALNLPSIIVKFESMNDDALVKCIKDAASYANVKLLDDEIEYVKQDLLRAESGCKGAYPKVQVVGKSVRQVTDL